MLYDEQVFAIGTGSSVTARCSEAMKKAGQLNLNFIDTPGVLDTARKDDEILSIIRTYVEAKAKTGRWEIDCVLFVLKFNDTRVPPQTVLEQYEKMLSQEVWSRTVVVLTFSNCDPSSLPRNPNRYDSAKFREMLRTNPAAVWTNFKADRIKEVEAMFLPRVGNRKDAMPPIVCVENETFTVDEETDEPILRDGTPFRTRLTSLILARARSTAGVALAKSLLEAPRTSEGQHMAVAEALPTILRGFGVLFSHAIERLQQSLGQMASRFAKFCGL